MGLVEIEEGVYKDLSLFIDKKKEKEPYKSFTIKEFVNQAIIDKMNIEKFQEA